MLRDALFKLRSLLIPTCSILLRWELTRLHKPLSTLLLVSAFSVPAAPLAFIYPCAFHLVLFPSRSYFSKVCGSAVHTCKRGDSKGNLDVSSTLATPGCRCWHDNLWHWRVCVFVVAGGRGLVKLTTATMPVSPRSNRMRTLILFSSDYRKYSHGAGILAQPELAPHLCLLEGSQVRDLILANSTPHGGKVHARSAQPNVPVSP